MRIDHLLWDSGNLSEIARHAVRSREIDDMVYFDLYVYRSNPRYPGQIKVIGRTPGGRWLTVPMERTPLPGVWRPVTAWPSTAAEIDEYAAHRS